MLNVPGTLLFVAKRQGVILDTPPGRNDDFSKMEHIPFGTMLVMLSLEPCDWLGQTEGMTRFHGLDKRPCLQKLTVFPCKDARVRLSGVFKPLTLRRSFAFQGTWEKHHAAEYKKIRELLEEKEEGCPDSLSGKNWP
jgi:hypothetical protein